MHSFLGAEDTGRFFPSGQTVVYAYSDYGTIERRDGERFIRVEPSREFLYVEDAADGIVRAAERIDTPEPINLGTGKEVRVKDLVEMMVDGDLALLREERSRG